MSRFEVSATPLSGLTLVRRQRLGDSRGFLARLFCAEELAAAGWHGPIAQINHTFTARQGTVRGLHFQRPPHAEAKLVSCLRGRVWDVAVDVRQGSPTFLHWHAQELSADNGLALLIPAGFAHGFQALSDDVELLYCHSAAHAPQAEGGLNPQDPRLAIAWPVPITELSARDVGHALLGESSTETFTGIHRSGP
jgi:dTDP-4-dehydrorhamnose 3,5-epimerase